MLVTDFVVKNETGYYSLLVKDCSALLATGSQKMDCYLKSVYECSALLAMGS